jgi:hypothetical protein
MAYLSPCGQIPTTTIITNRSHLERICIHFRKFKQEHHDEIDAILQQQELPTEAILKGFVSTSGNSTFATAVHIVEWSFQNENAILKVSNL